METKNLNQSNNIQGQTMQFAYNPTFSTTYANILRDTALKHQIETEYTGTPLPLITTPIEINAQFDFPDPDIPGFLSTIIDYIQELQKIPIPNLDKLIINTYINIEFALYHICIITPNGILPDNAANAICKTIRDNSDNMPKTDYLPLPQENATIIKISETF